MAAYIRQKPARWFMPLAVVLLLWALMGCASLYAHIAFGADMDPNATDWDRAFYDAIPLWLTVDYGVSVVAGLLGALALLFRAKIAKQLFIVSLVGVVVQFGYIFAATDLVAHKGAVTTVPFPLFIAAVTAFEIWLAHYATRRGWIS